MPIIHFYRTPALSESRRKERLRQFPSIKDIESEYCFNVEASAPLTGKEMDALRWLLSETFETETDKFGEKTFLLNMLDSPVKPGNDEKGGNIIEVGPRLNFQTAWSTNAVSVCRAAGITKITRIERSRRFKLIGNIADADFIGIKETLYDRMTECLYPTGINSFETDITPEPVKIIPVLEEGRAALEKINRELGLGLDEWDMDFYHDLFVKDMKRNPTNVECFDLGQSNSEHSRHWFFRGRLVIDGKEMPYTLMEIIKAPYKKNPGVSVIAFKDNSSAIKGSQTLFIGLQSRSQTPLKYEKQSRLYNIIFTAETHNFPSGVAPFPGAETGTGGRIRDVQAVGRGGHVIAGTAAYCVGNLLIPGYELPWEDRSFKYPPNLASPLRIEIEASNGASDYGNKFGEPVIQGFTRSFGLRLPDGERREWIKPIMFTGGVGQMDDKHTEKLPPEKGMLVVKVGGPAYRIGMGGGAASSMVQGENVEALDFNAVQRGDAEMEQKLNRVIRACVEMGEDNPIISIHDQGAGGNCNVLKELVYPEGAKIDIRKIELGDMTLSVLEIWGAEYQENNALLLRPKHKGLFESICGREKVPVSFIGEITGDAKIVVYDTLSDVKGASGPPVDLDLKKVLGEMPRKTFNIDRKKPYLRTLDLPKDLTVRDALERVLRLVSVGSKRFLTNKVDRSVTGLIARQQCAGPLQLTVSDVAVIAQSHFGVSGGAISIGEQPIKGLINPASMARMSVAEALTNIVWARISRIEDIRCSANWMWAAKLPGEGALIYDAAVAMSDFMTELGIAVDGGKDSLSMAALAPDEKGPVKAPGSLVISAYAPVPDVTKVITPDIKRAGDGRLIYIDLGIGKHRMGGSSLAHTYEQTGDDCPDIDAGLLKKAFNAVQNLIENGLILSGHDVSDGGLITTLLEMAFSGNCGLKVELDGGDPIAVLFSEEVGLVIEYMPENETKIREILEDIPFKKIGESVKEKRITISNSPLIKINPSAPPLIKGGEGGLPVLDDSMIELREMWEETSYQLERLQMNPECADEENRNIKERTGPAYKNPPSSPFSKGGIDSLLLNKKATDSPLNSKSGGILKVAIIREEGSNGDREMASAFYRAGFETYDVTMTDLIEGRASLDKMRGVAFVGGFSYADVLDSAKGWAGVIRYNEKLKDEFERFYNRPDTFSLGVCNGCQLAALLGWVPWRGIEGAKQPRFIHNKSGRFESRFATVKILESPSIFLKGMEGSVLGVWVAHGEGRAYFPDDDIYKKVASATLAPVRYVDDGGEITESYPFNPNGSPDGIAALCSPDGRHLAIMPHPERSFLKWQWGWMPEDWKKGPPESPWFGLFENARKWCYL